ncbi:MAG: substrate-binding domain-containing protein, partial [Ktedonobacteraceae bacterium]|nr:substrate-binding domain-containing protein [Ktedonobacteraceae bacterium]
VPVVVANNEIEGLRVDEVVVDSLRGGCLAAEYLLRLGHRRIGYICGSQEEHRQARRTVGFCRTLEQAGVALHPQALVYGDTRYESGRRCMQELLRRDLDLTAVFVFDDLMALGALNWLLTNSYRVPEDLSLIGFDDILYSSAVVPALTTIAQPIAEIGAECMRLVLERIRDPERPPSRVMLPTQLIERSSCRSLHSSPGIFGK